MAQTEATGTDTEARQTRASRRDLWAAQHDLKSLVGRAAIGLAASGITVALVLGALLLVERSGRVPAQMTIIVSLATLALLFCALAPVHTLPFVALMVFALGPQRLLPDLLQDVPPSAVVLGIWALRKSVRARGTGTYATAAGRNAVIASLFSLLTWMVFSAAFSLDRRSSLLWLIAFAISVVPVVMIKDAGREKSLLLRGWVVFGAALGAYGVLEFALQRNPVYGFIYSFFGGDGQHWESYRSSMSLGSPVFAGMFLAASSSLAVAAWLQRRGGTAAIGAVLNLAGLAVTLTRGGYIAFAVALCLGLAFLVVRRQGSALRGVAVIGVIAAAAWWAVQSIPALAERILSDEASGSLTQRTRTVDLVLQRVVTLNTSGSGPDTSSLAMGDLIVDLRYVENSYLQLLLDLGFVGLIIFCVWLLTLFVAAARRSDLAACMLAAAFFVSLGTYNAIDDQHGTITVLALVALICLNKLSDLTTERGLPISAPQNLR